MTKYIFITGGVVSSLGKGIIAASLGRLLRARGFSVINQKFDPYINVDPGTMSPFQHGEVFVTDDGAETDLDLGHYERFTDTNLGKYNNVTSGSVYQHVIEKERRGDYLGGTVQVIPHITNEIKSRIMGATKQFKPDFQLIEIGGTIGDIESLPFIEAIRQFKTEVGIGNAVSVHCTLIPYLPTSGELKTKPSQHSVSVLRSYGIQPEILVCRTTRPIPKTEKEKLALFCSVPKDAVIECRDMKSIYEVPLALEEQNMAHVILDMLRVQDRTPDLKAWQKLVENIKNSKKTLNVAIAGKYTKLSDAYISVVESLKHAGYANDTKIEIKWINSEECVDYKNCKELMKGVNAVVVPGGFGVRGIEGKLNVIRYARENNLPFLGLCLGMQCAVIEYARNVLGIKDANSKEFDENAQNPVIDLMLEQKNVQGYGGTMSEVNSYIGCVQMNDIDVLLEKQKQNAIKWDERLDYCKLNNRKEIEPNYWVYGILSENKISDMLNFRGKGFYASGVHLPNNYYSVFGSQEELPGVQEFYHRFMALPSGWWFEQ